MTPTEKRALVKMAGYQIRDITSSLGGFLARNERVYDWALPSEGIESDERFNSPASAVTSAIRHIQGKPVPTFSYQGDRGKVL